MTDCIVTECTKASNHIALQRQNEIEQTGWSHCYSGGVDGNVFGHIVNSGWIIVVLYKVDYREA